MKSSSPLCLTTVLVAAVALTTVNGFKFMSKLKMPTYDANAELVKEKFGDRSTYKYIDCFVSIFICRHRLVVRLAALPVYLLLLLCYSNPNFLFLLLQQTTYILIITFTLNNRISSGNWYLLRIRTKDSISLIKFR